MLSERELKDVIEKIIGEMKTSETPVSTGANTTSANSTNYSNAASSTKSEETRENPHIVNGEVRDIGKINVKEQMLVDNPEDREEYMKLKQKTSGRLGIGSA